ncbi:hypothetical protein BDV19DRAFT_384819 [Aspergillus venezuelensis]
MSLNTWRNLLFSSLQAIDYSYSPTANKGIKRIPAVRLHNINAISHEVMLTPRLHTFLSRLTSLSMELEYADLHLWSGTFPHRPLSPTPFPLDFDLGPKVFNHLASFEDLTFNANNAVKMGRIEHFRHLTEDTGLRDAHMPRLRDVTLTNISICAELREFLVRHLHTLKSVELHDCYAYSPLTPLTPTPSYPSTTDPNMKTWKELFASITTTTTTNQHHFHIRTTSNPT